ncbi:MAG: Xaa-Pro peptidase family protein [Acidobacteriota bacterium]
MIPKDQERIDRIRRELRHHQLDGLLLLHPDNILMTTGMLPGSTHVAALVTTDAEVAVLSPWWREEFVSKESWADSIDTFDWCRGFNGVEPVSAMMEILRSYRQRYHLERVGFDGHMHHYGPTKLPSEFFTYDEVKAGLPEIFKSAVDVGPLLAELKAIKTAREIAQLRRTHHVAEAGIRAFYGHARAGLTELELAAEVNYAVLKMAGQKGIRYTYCDPPQITSGADRTFIADTMSNHATDRVLRTGDMVMLELGVQADGYWADITRSLVVGGPTDTHLKLHAALLQAQTRAVAAYVPGQSTGEALCEEAWSALREAGFAAGITHFLGHGLGFAYHEELPILGPNSSDVLQAGNVTSLEPGLYWQVDGKRLGGMRVEDNVAWGNEPGKGEILSNFYRGLNPAEW